MIKIEVKDTNIEERQGKKAPYWKQTAYAFTLDRDGKPNAYPERISLFVQKDERGFPQPYQPGMYQLMPNSIRVGRFGDLEMGFLNLQPLKN